MKRQGTGVRAKARFGEDQGSGRARTLKTSATLPDVGKSRHWAGVAVVLLAAAVATGPQLFRGSSYGHDFNFHLVSWLDCLNAWRHGLIYPHWAPSANFGAGEPRFVFYPPLTWMLGAALGVALPWPLVPIALTFLLLAATGLATRALAQEALPDGAATLAGCAALFSGYALFTAYERCAFGELTGGFWIPLLLLFALRERRQHGPAWRRALDGSAVPLAMAVAGAWLSNAPLGVMASYLLAAVALASAVMARSWTPVIRATTGAVGGMALAAVYLVPAGWEQNWVDIHQATIDPAERIENSWMFARHADPALAAHDSVLLKVSLIGASMIGVAVAGLLLSWLRGSLSASRRWWIPLALIPAAILFLQFPVSWPVWHLLPKLKFLQFPWRWLVALEAPMAICVAAAVWPRKNSGGKRWRQAAVTVVSSAVFLACAAMAGQFFFQACDDGDTITDKVNIYRSGHGFEGTYEYAPVGADNSELATGLPGACLTAEPGIPLGAPGSNGVEDAPPEWKAEQRSCEAVFPLAADPESPTPEHLRVKAKTSRAGYLILRLRSYPAWQVTLNGRRVERPDQREDGLMAVAAPEGNVDLAVRWGTTPDTMAGRWLSGLGVLALACLWLVERRKSRSGLS